MNPYDFVPIVEANKPEQRRPEGHDKFSGIRGFIECKISTLKPFFIPHPRDDDEERKRQGLREPIERNNKVEYHEKYVLHRINGIPIIPGSSIKGVIRSVAEAAANSCVTFFVQKQNYSSKKFDPATEQTITVDSQFRLPDGFYPCTDINKLCITCRLFGFQSQGNSFQGKVNISDAMARNGYNDKVLDFITLTELSSPKPHHKTFYALSISDPDKIAGRKFYFHHKPDAHILPSREKTPRNSSVKPLDKDAIFDFKVSFTNLADDEYNLLLYSLFLEDGVCHKMGYGKPAGLGSVKIEALKLTLFLDTEKRYKKFMFDDKEVYEGDKLKTYITEQTKSYREDKSDNLEALRRIWKWPGEYDIQYPDFHEWFKIYPSEPISRTP
jgi:CRISPR/Cas system CSM-associated protein Csm3 (group 7 of RAMP superfamily)